MFHELGSSFVFPIPWDFVFRDLTTTIGEVTAFFEIPFCFEVQASCISKAVLTLLTPQGWGHLRSGASSEKRNPREVSFFFQEQSASGSDPLLHKPTEYCLLLNLCTYKFI